MTAPREAATIVLLRGTPFEVLLVRRHAKSGFMAGALVFPGGKVEDADRAADPESAFRVAACRETREEAGIEIDPSALVYWAHWITPSMEPRRFDTRFFIAEVPPDQAAHIDRHEVTESVWLTPAEALARHARGEIYLPPPTQRTLEELATHADFAAIRAAAETRVIRTILPKIAAIGEELAIVLPWDPLYLDTEGDGLPWEGPVPDAESRIFLRPRAP